MRMINLTLSVPEVKTHTHTHTPFSLQKLAIQWEILQIPIYHDKGTVREYIGQFKDPGKRHLA